MNRKCNIHTLNQVEKGQNFIIKNIADPVVRCQSTRLGMCDGQVLKCIHCTHNGPMVLQKRYQEIALGNNLAKNIEIQLV